MKKFFALLLAAVMMFAVACDAGADPAAEATDEPAAAAEQKADEAAVPAAASDMPAKSIIYGNTTQVNRDFVNGWTNNATNAYIKNLIHGGNDTWALTSEGGVYIVNPRVVVNMDTTDNEDGTKTFTYQLTDDRVWNDGTPITAKDYCFSILLYSHPYFDELDANADGGYDYVGYNEYLSGESNVFPGVRLLGEQEFSITVRAEELPQYYDYLMAIVGPRPLHHLAPGADLKDDGEGCYITEEFTAEVLRETMMNEETGYRYNPQVTCGAYNFVSYNATDYTAIIELNPLFCGTFDGVMPKIEQIIFKFTIQATQMQELEAGSIDLLTGIMVTANIEEGLALVERGLIETATSTRYGYGFIRFHCDQSPTQFASVRQAIGFLLDREEFNRQYASGYAVTVDSEYSFNHYIYNDNKEYLEENLIHYMYNPERAAEILDADGWLMGDDGIRHKKVDGEDMPLVIEWLSSQDNVVSDLIRSMLVPEAEKIGMKINETAVVSVIDDASRNNIRDEDAKYFMFNLAFNFGIPDVPYNRFSDRPAFWGGLYNNTFLLDDELIRITRDMYYTPSGDKEAYDKLWLEFLLKWNELLPSLPLYSNTMFDFFNPKLVDFQSTPLWNPGFALQYADVAVE